MSLKNTEEALALLAKFIEDCGPCEHAVNICVCGEKQIYAEALAEVNALKTAARALQSERPGVINDKAIDAWLDMGESIVEESK